MEIHFVENAEAICTIDVSTLRSNSALLIKGITSIIVLELNLIVLGNNNFSKLSPSPISTVL